MEGVVCTYISMVANIYNLPNHFLTGEIAAIIICSVIVGLVVLAVVIIVVVVAVIATRGEQREVCTLYLYFTIL